MWGFCASFAATSPPRLWKPSPQSPQKLQHISRRRQALQHMLTQEKNRLRLCRDAGLKRDIEEHIEFLQEKTERLKSK